ncbi:STAS domain-containing protein [Micromonospora sp. NPDC049101]|uniref:STAS domain-containing protein n=1 Tax=unclassified Micromonospora TaxID=2617518 RepID=UPI0033F331CD
MRVEKSMRENTTVIALIGDLDSATASQVHNDLGQLIPDEGHLLLDLSRMSYLSSAGLRVLLLVYRQARQKGLRLALAGIPADVHAVLSATGFIEAFLVADTVDAGVEALSR